jgi:hypothetical protein
MEPQYPGLKVDSRMQKEMQRLADNDANEVFDTIWSGD